MTMQSKFMECGCCIAQPIGFKVRTLRDADRFLSEGFFAGMFYIPDIKKKVSGGFYVLRELNGTVLIGYGRDGNAMPVLRRATRMDIYTARVSINHALFRREF